jgi:hypothetical protein
MAFAEFVSGIWPIKAKSLALQSQAGKGDMII